MWPLSNSRPTSSPVSAIRRSTSDGDCDVRAHVVVIGEPHAVRERVPRERADPVGVLAPGGVRDEARPLVQRLRRALDAVGDFAVDHHRSRRCRQAARDAAPTAAISSATERRASRPEYQPDTSSSPCARQHRGSAFDSRGNLLPSSKPW